MIQAVKGMEDVLPDTSWKWELIEGTIRRHFHTWGYQEIRTPVLENLDLFKRGVGEGTDVVSKEMYTLKDRNDQELALRPEGTAPVIRALIEHHWMAQRELERVFYLASYFRYEKPQKGRLRQFHQYGIELLGADDPFADAEVISLFWDLYSSCFQLKNVECHLNSMGCAECSPVYKKNLTTYLLSREAEYCEDCRKRMRQNPLRVLDCKVERCRTLNAKAPLMKDFLCANCSAHFQSVQGTLKDVGVPYSLDPTIVRGFDYYQRTTFEFSSTDLGAQSAVGGGGRYDKLYEELGGRNPLPSVGYAGGVERLHLILDANKYWEGKQPKRSLFLCLMGAEARKRGFRLGTNIRRDGVDAQMIFGDKSIKAQLKQADRTQSRYCLIVGDRELQAGEAPLKCLADGSQKNVSLTDLGWLKELKDA